MSGSPGVGLYTEAAQLFSSLVRQIQPELWTAPTPNSEWNVRDLVNHVVGENLWIAPLLAGKTVADVGTKYDGDVLGEEPISSADTALADALAAVDGDGIDDKKVNLSRGETPATQYLEEMFVDQLIHAWDLAAAIGADRELPEKLVIGASSYFNTHADDWRSGGAFGPQVNVDAEASAQDKLLALTGRDPAWKSGE